MTKKKKIQLKGFLLLLTYLVSVFPFSIFHHHEKDLVIYEKASHCQKFVYYGKASDNCSHHSHISKKTEKCSLCDDHTVTPQVLNNLCGYSFYTHCNSYNPAIILSAVLRNVCSHTNKGPPIA